MTQENGQAAIPIVRTTNSNGSANLPMRAALVNGLSGLPQQSSVGVKCDSGNCTFPATGGITHTTLKFNTHCVDASSYVSQSGRTDWRNISGRQHYSPESSWTNYSLPSGLSLGYVLLDFEDFVPEDGQRFVWDMASHWDKLFTVKDSVMHEQGSDQAAAYLALSFEEQRIRNASLAAFEILIPNINPCEDRNVWISENEPFDAVNNTCPELDLDGVVSFPGPFSVAATVCFIYPLVQHFHGEVNNGDFREVPIGDPMLMGNGNLTPRPRIADMTTYFYMFLDSCDAGESTTVQDADGSNVTGSVDCLYSLSYSWSHSLSFALIGTIQDWDTSCRISLFDPYGDIDCLNGWWLEGLYNKGHASHSTIRRLVEQATNALNAQFRGYATDTNGQRLNASGTEYQNHVCTQFRWQWLLFPLAIILGVATLLIATIFKDMRSTGSAMGWKSSVIPLLFYGMETNPGLDLLKEDALYKISKETKAQFREGDVGWRFCKEE